MHKYLCTGKVKDEMLVHHVYVERKSKLQLENL